MWRNLAGHAGDVLAAPGWGTVSSFTGRMGAGPVVEFATRAYDVESRVWVQEDSYAGTVTRASSLNRYAYVEGAPESFADAWGAYRAAAAVAAQQLGAVEYYALVMELKHLALVGMQAYRAQVEIEAALAELEAQSTSCGS